MTVLPVIVPLETPSLGDRSYLAHDGRLALAVDPQRDIDRVLAVADDAGVRIGHVFETHIHNDYVTGGLALAHGFGSFCSPGSTGGATESTLGREKRTNPALTVDEETWVGQTLGSQDAFPAYYAHMAPLNSAGPSAPDLSPPQRADKGTLARRIAGGEWVVDLRSRTAFAAGHVTGTLNVGLDGAFSTYLGWLIPWGAPLTRLGSTPEQVAEAQRELVRIGIDHLRGAATGAPQEWTDAPLGAYPRAVFADLAQVRRHRPVTVLDVRLAGEHAQAHVTGAVGIPVHELPGRVDELPSGEIWVHCATGYRASIAASLLAAAGTPVVVIDDDVENARTAGPADDLLRLTDRFPPVKGDFPCAVPSGANSAARPRGPAAVSTSTRSSAASRPLIVVPATPSNARRGAARCSPGSSGGADLAEKATAGTGATARVGATLPRVERTQEPVCQR